MILFSEIERRKLDAQEVKYLMLKSYVNEVQVTLGKFVDI